MSTTTDRSILLVHGRDFKPAESSLMEISVAALRAGVERDYADCVEIFDSLGKDMAYFGDLNNAYLESLGQHYDESLDVGDRNNALASLRTITARKRFGIREYDCLPGKSALREFCADIMAPILGAIGMTMPLVGWVARDCAEYFKNGSGFTDQVRSRVRDKLCELFDRGDKILLMTHGMGCVAAYDVLWQLSHEPEYAERYPDAKIDTWLTLGAPLGDLYIRRHLLGAGEKAAAQFPTNVISWYNVAAEDDFTCHDNTLADDFKKMLDQRLVSAVRDYRIYNLAVRYGKSNPHSSVGYYIHPRVSKILVEWMRADSVGEMPRYTA